MKKISFAFLSLALVSLFLCSCASQPGTTAQQNKAEDANQSTTNGMMGSHY